MGFISLFTLTVSFLVVVILSLWIEKGLCLVNINQKRPTSPFVRNSELKQLMPFLGRYTAIGLRYLELITIALIALAFEKFVNLEMQKNNSFIFPILIIFIPISFLTVTICVPKKSKDFFEPYWYEIFLCIILIGLGGYWLYIKLTTTI